VGSEGEEGEDGEREAAGARGRLRRSGSGQRRRRRSGSDELGGGEVCEGGVDLAREGRRDRATSYRGEDY
jgi:hypothetical protein